MNALTQPTLSLEAASLGLRVPLAEVFAGIEPPPEA
jgi:hypothetical protein